jgi:hypothetical protein
VVGCPMQVGIVSWGEGCAEAKANADRDVTLIYPNKFVQAPDIGHVEANSRVAIPGPGVLPSGVVSKQEDRNAACTSSFAWTSLRGMSSVACRLPHMLANLSREVGSRSPPPTNDQNDRQ